MSDDPDSDKCSTCECLRCAAAGDAGNRYLLVPGGDEPGKGRQKKHCRGPANAG